MMLTTALIALGLGFASPQDQTAPPDVAERAGRCHETMEMMILEAGADGHIAAPTWFIRDWWAERVPEAADTHERRTADQQALVRLKAEDPDAFLAERRACVNTALDAGAVPGM